MCIRDRNRSYEGLVKRLEFEGIKYMKCLPWEMKIDDYFDDTFINDKNLPDVVMKVVEEYDDKITYLMSVSYTHLDVYRRQCIL